MRIPNIVRRHPVPTTVGVLLGVPIVAFALWTVVSLSYSYSSDRRSGLLQKISRRGWLCKTWEGELQMNALPGATPEIFNFTVRSDSIAAELGRLAGRRVVLDYKEHVGVPGSCFGDTEFYVVGVRQLASQ